MRVFFLFLYLFIFPAVSMAASCKIGEYNDNGSCSDCSDLGRDFGQSSGMWPNSDPTDLDRTDESACYRIEVGNISLGEKRVYLKKETNTDNIINYVDGDTAIVCTAEHSQENETKDGCECKPGYKQDGTGESATCIADIKKITLKANCGVSSDNKTDLCPGTTKEITLYASYDYGLGVASTGPFGNNKVDGISGKQLVDEEIQKMSRNLYKLVGFFLDTDNNNASRQVLKDSGEFADNYAVQSFYGDNAISTTLYAHWQRDFKIDYYCPTGGSIHTQDCSKSDVECEKLYTLESGKCSNPGGGKVFTDWDCVYSGNGTSAAEGSLISDMINSLNIKYDKKNVVIQCTMQKGDCPENYYCDNSGKHKCPWGSKSDKGTKDITDCYINNSVTFRDNYGTFTLPIPDGVEAKYVK